MADTISPYKFLGASVVSFSQSGGNDGSPVVMNAILVEDPLAGDGYDPPPLWHPVHFGFGEFEFRGLLRSSERTTDVQNCPAYRVVVTDPRPLVEGVTIILGDYRGRTDDAPNLINAFGYWEDRLGFGGALVSDLGMLWKGGWARLGLRAGGFVQETSDPVGVAPAIEAITRDQTPFGGPLNFRGRPYKLDLSGLPAASENYRVGVGTAAPLTAIVEALCTNAGCDYQVVLVDDETIGFRSLDRNAPQAPGVIAQWAASQENCKVKTTGLELVNETMNVEVVGGQIQSLYQVSDQGQSIWPYWGVEDVQDGANLVWGQGDPAEKHVFSVPCLEVADVVGADHYPCSIAELRAAAADVDSWTAYLFAQEPEKAAALGVISIIQDGSELMEIFGDTVLPRDLLNYDVETAHRFGLMNEIDFWSNRVQRMYDFVSRLANENYGRRFCVRIPEEVYWKVVPDSFQVLSSSRISDGGWAPEGGAPLGLPYEDVDLFLTDDGRFSCFVTYPLNARMNLSLLPPDSYTIANGTLYVQADADERIYYNKVDGMAYAVVTVPAAVCDFIPDPLGGVPEIAAMLNMTPEQLANAVAWRSSTFPVRIVPKAYKPSGVALPIASDRDRYGPWKSINGQGKTEFVVNEDLTPWGCGDLATMEQVGSALVQTYATKRFEVETGQATLVGAPSVPVGRALIAGGPLVTRISVNVSAPEGITTEYTMRTYTPNPGGGFSRYQADKLRKAGENARIGRRTTRNVYRRQKARYLTRLRTEYEVMHNTSMAVAQRSPHEMILGFSVRGGPGEDPEQWKCRQSVANMNPQEFLANMRGDKAWRYGVSGGMSLEGLFRPFSTNFDPENYPEPEDDGGSEGDEEQGAPTWKPWEDLAHFEDPDEALVSSDRKLLTTAELNPFREGCDIDLLITGEEYKGNLHRKKGAVPPDYKNARPIALRGPLVVTGPGVDVCGKPVPNAEEGYEAKQAQDWSDDYLEDHLLHPEKWKAGVVGLMWCKWTGSWLAPGVHLKGKIPVGGEIGAGGLGDMLVDKGFDEYDGEKMLIWNPHGVKAEAGAEVTVGYFPLQGHFGILTKECGSGS